MRRELVTGFTVRRYDQLETSSNNCDLQFANADRQTYRLMENYSNDVIHTMQLMCVRH